MSAPDPQFQSADRMIVRIGVGITLIAFTTAVVLHFVRGDAPLVISNVLPLAWNFREVAPMMAQVFQWDAFAIGQLSCLILVAIPVARVIAATFYLAIRREWIIAVIGTAIVVILATTAVIDLAARNDSTAQKIEQR